MLFSGQAVKASLLPSGIAKLIFDLEGSSVNKFDQLTLKELGEAVAAIGESDARGVIFSSAKSTFIVGADITEFTDLFATGPEAIRTWIGRANEVFNAVEDLSIPTVAAINGVALGGGFDSFEGLHRAQYFAMDEKGRTWMGKDEKGRDMDEHGRDGMSRDEQGREGMSRDEKG